MLSFFLLDVLKYRIFLTSLFLKNISRLSLRVDMNKVAVLLICCVVGVLLSDSAHVRAAVVPEGFRDQQAPPEVPQPGGNNPDCPGICTISCIEDLCPATCCC